MQQNYILALEGQLKSGGRRAKGQSSDETVALQSKLAALSAELSEEREESARQGQEVAKLTALLKDKERLLIEAGELMKEAERHCEEHRMKVESLETQRNRLFEQQQELESAKQGLTEKFEFQLSELKVEVDKLTKERDRLQDELEKDTNLSGSASPADMAAAASFTSAPAAEPSHDSPTLSQLFLTSDAIDKLAVQFKLSLEATEYFKSHESSLAAAHQQSQDQVSGVRGVSPSTSRAVHRLQSVKKVEYDRLRKELEQQRSKLSTDLQLAAEKNMELEMQLTQVKNGEAAEVFSAKERSHMRLLLLLTAAAAAAVPLAPSETF
jgi:hypothetical protein